MMRNILLPVRVQDEFCCPALKILYSCYTTYCTRSPYLTSIDPYHSMSKQKILPVEPLIQCEAGRAKTMQRQSLYSPRTPKWPPSDKGELPINDLYFAGIDWSCVTDQTTCEGKLQVFTDIVANGLSNIMPERTIKIYPRDAPWMSVKLKKLIHMRQHAFYANKCGLAYKFYRNAVNRERKLCRAKYYASEVKDLKGVNPRQWWNET